MLLLRHHEGPKSRACEGGITGRVGNVADPDHWVGTKIWFRLFGSLTALVPDLGTQGHYQHTALGCRLVFSTYLRAIEPHALYECVFWLHGRQAFLPQLRHSKMNQCPVELQKEQFH